MFIIFGTKKVAKTVQKGNFDCPRSQTQREYQLKQNRKFFSIFFIPLIPLDKLGDSLECSYCKTAYIPNAFLSETEYQSSTKNIDSLEKPLASAGKRFGGYVLDIIFLVFLNFPLAFLAKYLPEALQQKFILVFLPVWILYFFIMEVAFKGTLGKKIVSIQTVSQKEGEPVSAIRHLIRSIIKIIPLINIILLFNDKKQGCHDFAANTIVVEK